MCDKTKTTQNQLQKSRQTNQNNPCPVQNRPIDNNRTHDRNTEGHRPRRTITERLNWEKIEKRGRKKENSCKKSSQEPKTPLNQNKNSMQP